MQTDCCPELLGFTLQVTVVGGGVCNGTYPVDYDPSLLPSFVWRYFGAIGTCPPSGSVVANIDIYCASSVWALLTAGSAIPYGATSASCGPLVVSFDNVDLTTCGGTANATLVLTL